MSAYLIHSGSKGMRWGVRRWQNKDGSLTPAGRERYGVGSARGEGSSGGSDASSSRKKKIKTALKVAAGVAIAAGAAYGGYRLSKNPAVRAALSRGVSAIRGTATNVYNRARDVVGKGKSADMGLVKTREHWDNVNHRLFFTDNESGGQVGLGRLNGKSTRERPLNLHSNGGNGNVWEGHSKRTQRGESRSKKRNNHVRGFKWDREAYGHYPTNHHAGVWDNYEPDRRNRRR